MPVYPSPLRRNPNMNSLASVEVAEPVPKEAGAPRAPRAEAPEAEPARARDPGAKKSADAGAAKPKSKPAAAPAPRKEFKDRSFATVMVSTTLGVGLAYLIGRSGKFTPGDDWGYYIGLVGGVMMLLLLLYPLRKHVATFRNWGAVKHWFAVHMVLGIAGPVLVLAHSTFHMRSTNASVALVCMLIVAGSGIVGRFFYTKVHRGLYGEKLNLKDLQDQTGLESAEIESRLHFVPTVEQRLADFQAYAVEPRAGLAAELTRFFVLGVRLHQDYRACRRDLEVALQASAQARGWDKAKYERRLKAACALVHEYLSVSRRVAEFGVYDRLLQLWHVAHVPLVYLLVISGIAHVVAVHMY